MSLSILTAIVRSPRHSTFSFTRFCAAAFCLTTCLTALSVVAPRQAVADEAAEQMVLATYKLANGSSTAVGLVVTGVNPESPRRYVVTANHVLDQMKGDSCKLVARDQLANKSYQRREVAIPIRKNGQPLWSRHGSHDLAVLPLAASVKVSALPFESLASDAQAAKLRSGDLLSRATFPERVESNGAGFPLLRQGAVASFPVQPVHFYPSFLIDTNSWKGDSGGPVMHAKMRAADKGPLVIGFVWGMRNVTDIVQESRFVHRRRDYPLGLSEVVHAAFARAMIEALEKNAK